MTNNGRKLANFAGFYKYDCCSTLFDHGLLTDLLRGIQSAGAAVSWRLDAVGVAYMSLFISNWVLLAASLVVAAPVMLWKIKDTVSLEEDLKFSDETIEDVSPQYQMHAIGQRPDHREV